MLEGLSSGLRGLSTGLLSVTTSRFSVVMDNGDGTFTVEQLIRPNMTFRAEDNDTFTRTF